MFKRKGRAYPSRTEADPWDLSPVVQPEAVESRKEKQIEDDGGGERNDIEGGESNIGRSITTRVSAATIAEWRSDRAHDQRDGLSHVWLVK